MQKQDALIRMIVQPDYTFLYDILCSFGQKSTASIHNNIDIEHIICMDNTETLPPGIELDYNIFCLKTMLPLHTCLDNYHPYYYYENVHSRFHPLSLFPCLILTSRYAIIFSSDICHGIFFSDHDNVRALQTLFLEQMAHTQPLTKRISAPPVNSAVNTSTIVQMDADTCSFAFSAEPCIRTLITPFHIEKYVNRQIPNRTAIIQQISNSLYYKEKSLLNSNTFFTFTKSGIQNFLKTGIVSEVPNGFFDPFLPDDRNFVLNKLRDYVLAGNALLLTGVLSNLPLTAHLSIHPKSLDMFFPSINGTINLLHMKEPSFIDAFFDFAYSAEEVGIFASKEEGAAFLESLS